jgi:ligand-binding SRPBCC domain-containing protein
MIKHILRKSMTLPLPLEQVFAFFSQAENLERITPPEMNFQYLTPLPIEIRQDALVEYRIRLYGVPMKWLTKIALWNPPHSFIDKQLKGPYTLWVHQHLFHEDELGNTVIEDQVTYALPLSPLGDIAHPIVRWQIERIFNYRQEITRQILLNKPAAKIISSS